VPGYPTWPRLPYLLGISGLALALTALRRRGARGPGLLAAGFAALALAGGGLVVARTPPFQGTEYAFIRDRVGSPGAYRQPLPHEPVCRAGGVTVCVHPAYAGKLPEVAATINRISEPLAGLPGLPRRAQQHPAVENLRRPPGVVGFVLRGSSFNHDLTERRGLRDFAFQFVAAPDHEANGPGDGSSQEAIALWLLRRAGAGVTCEDFLPYGYPADPSPELRAQWGDRSLCEAAERFGRLSAGEQRRWLEANYARLRNRDLTARDVP
jgi:hypothetical protein